MNGFDLGDPFTAPGTKSVNGHVNDDRVKKIEENISRIGEWAKQVNKVVQPWSAPGTRSYEEIKAYEKDRERARREVRRELDEEEAINDHVSIPDGISLRELLSRPIEPIPYRINGLLPRDGRAILAAPMKAGKTTFVGNFLRSLVDGEPFLGRFDVTPVTGRVILFDFEMPETLIQEWLRDQNIENLDAIHVYSMRGRGDSFNILSPTIRAEWAARIKALDGEVIIGDPVKPVLDSLGLSEHVEAGKLLTAFDALMNESGAKEALWTHHMGHNGERSRGDSTLRGWPDAEWKLVTERDPKTGERIPGTPVCFWAFGRDVDVPESELLYDKETRRLSFADPLNPETRNRSNAKERKELEKRNEKAENIVAFIEDNPGSKTQALQDAGIYQPRDSAILRELVAEKRIHFVKGKQNAKLYYFGPAPDEADTAGGEDE